MITPANRAGLPASVLKVRDLANSCCTVTVANLRKVVPGGMVLDTTIVPEDNRIGLPTDSYLKANPVGNVLIEHVEHCATFVPTEFHNFTSETRIYVERLSTCEWMCANHGVNLRWQFF